MFNLIVKPSHSLESMNYVACILDSLILQVLKNEFGTLFDRGVFFAYSVFSHGSAAHASPDLMDEIWSLSSLFIRYILGLVAIKEYIYIVFAVFSFLFLCFLHFCLYSLLFFFQSRNGTSYPMTTFITTNSTMP